MDTKPSVLANDFDVVSIINSIWRHWRILTIIVAVVMLLSGIITVKLIKPTYEAEAIYTLPSSDISESIGMNNDRYNEFALSNPIIEYITSHMPDEKNINLDTLKTTFEITLNTEASTMKVKYKAHDRLTAVTFLKTWYEAYCIQITNYAQKELTRKLTLLDNQQNTIDSSLDYVDTHLQKKGADLDNAQTMQVIMGLSFVTELVKGKIDKERLTYLKDHLSDNLSMEPLIKPYCDAQPLSPKLALSVIVSGLLALCLSIMTLFIRETLKSI